MKSIAYGDDLLRLLKIRKVIANFLFDGYQDGSWS